MEKKFKAFKFGASSRTLGLDNLSLKLLHCSLFLFDFVKKSAFIPLVFQYWLCVCVFF